MRSSVCGLLILCTGCGLGDYEDRMREAQAGAERCEADSGLDSPLGPPRDAVPDLFFRPPLGQVLVTDDAPPPGYTYHYERRPGANSFITDVYVIVLQGRPTGSDVGSIDKMLQPPGRDPLVFRHSEFLGDDEGSYSRWVLQGQRTTQVSLLYRCEKGHLPEAAAQIEKSAQSVTLGEGVEHARRSYARWEKSPATR